MVCLGNICRSPLAQGILEAQLREQNMDWTVDSAGTGAWHVGNPPDPRSVAVAAKHGLDISVQRARQVHWPDLGAFDLVLAMDQSNQRDLLRMAQSKEEQDRIQLILDYLDDAERARLNMPGGDPRSVPDPYWDDDGFEHVYQLLHAACARVLAAHRVG